MPVSPTPTPAAPVAALLLAVTTVCIAHDPGAAQDGPAGAPLPRETIAFVGVNVVPMDREEVVADQTVLVRDGVIEAVGPSAEVAVPDGAVHVDGQGRYLIPGLAEMHGHLPGGDAPRELIENTLFLYVANGVTLVRGMQGHPSQLETRAAIERGDLLGPRLLLAGPGFGGADLTAEDAARRVREQADAGYDLLKVGEGLRPEVYDAMASAAGDVGIPFAGHVPDAVGLFRALEAGHATVDHLDNYVEALVPDDAMEGVPALFGIARVAARADEARIPETVEATRRSGAAVVPTMVLWEHFFGDHSGEALRDALPDLRYMPTGTVDAWVRNLDNLQANIADRAGARRVLELRRDILRQLHEAGATILFGTDSPQMFSVPGFSTHPEMALMVDVGMTPYQVLRSATWTIAEHLGELDAAGSVTPGKRADLLLLEANPLDDIANVADRAGVVVDGRWLPKSEIRRRLDAIAGASE